QHVAGQGSKLALMYQVLVDGELPQELVKLIMSMSLLEDLMNNMDHPVSLIYAIERVCNACGPELAAEIVKVALKIAGKSLCDIKDKEDWTALHWAANNDCTEIVILLLAAAPTHEQATCHDPSTKLRINCALGEDG